MPTLIQPQANSKLLQSPLAVIGGHSRAVSYVRFLGDGRRLLTASTDSALKLWDIAAEMGRPAGQPAAPQLTYTGGWQVSECMELDCVENTLWNLMHLISVGGAQPTSL